MWIPKHISIIITFPITENKQANYSFLSIFMFRREHKQIVYPCLTTAFFEKQKEICILNIFPFFYQQVLRKLVSTKILSPSMKLLIRFFFLFGLESKISRITFYTVLIPFSRNACCIPLTFFYWCMLNWVYSTNRDFIRNAVAS